MNTKIMEELEAAYCEELNLLADDLGALEQAIEAKMRQLGQGLLQRLVQRQPNGYKGSSIYCNCGGSKRFVGHRTKNINTIFGWIKIERAYYHCRHCGVGLAPYDLDSGLGHGQLSAGLAKACCLLAVDDSFEQTSRKIEQLFGQEVSPNTIDRLTHQVGSVLLQQEDEQLVAFQTKRQIPDAQITPGRVYIAADGTTVHETDGWHESKLGVIYWEDGRGHRNSHYVGRFDNSEIFGWRRAVAVFVKLMRRSLWATARLGFAPKNADILTVRRSLLTGITPVSTCGIVQSHCSAKAVRRQRSG